MTALRPPFSGLAQYAAALDSLVRDKKCARPDADFVADAIDKLAEMRPYVETADIGDGATTEFELGAGVFLSWTLGFSEHQHVQVEQLDSDGTPIEPKAWLREDAFWIEERDGVSRLAFRDAPPASPQYRVHWRRRPVVNDSGTNEVRLHHQMALVYIAAAYKCEALVAAYAKTVDAHSSLFQGATTAEEYRKLAGTFWKRAHGILGVGRSGRLTHGPVRTGRHSIFPRGYA